ncbi:preprotein translocase subunit SecG [Paucilactobacillus suebicus]|uniref:Protein-export membrane protein SecG n=1 Tax=Paucilactobacillus suebicus DSM 5007 = KCTC 3549 TaxID=1423807 RepID=A0A0R1WFA7_9LACO|nr:preprotein translocase subunit SecG [Paucilactobacillus suebicus]KRM13574.1 preprotein translocase subunit SecG [Paucilactobacillus suebicus DSM 5007 = KCTC 3549]
MYNLLLTIFLILCVVIIACVMMQPAKNNNDAMSALTGGAGDLFSRRKARGFEAVMQITTTICGAIFFILALALIYLSSH